jgi:hypothetical protein
MAQVLGDFGAWSTQDMTGSIEVTAAVCMHGAQPAGPSAPEPPDNVSRCAGKAMLRLRDRRQPGDGWPLATLARVRVLDVLPGLLIGVISMLRLFVYHASRPHLAVLVTCRGTPGANGDLAYHPEHEPPKGVILLRLEAPLFYANADLVRDRIKWLVGHAAMTPTAVVLDIGANGERPRPSRPLLHRMRPE